MQNSFAGSTKPLLDLQRFIQMYNEFFAFKEKPFMLAPNPAYLFPGKGHEEALAHLIYAVSEPTAKPNRISIPKFPKTQGLAAKPTVLATSSPISEKSLELTAKMSYSVQVGAFLSRNLAQKLVGTLRRKGYPAIILEVTDPKTRTWHTVRIGDFPSREAAIQKADEFTSREKMESAVRPFEKL